jgi:hypothetical protein
MAPQDVTRILAHIAETIGTDPKGWVRWPGGWPGDIESALVDSVFSARARYKTKNALGIYARMLTWQATRGRQAYSLPALLAEIGSDVDGWAKRFGNCQHSPGRPVSAPFGPMKAATVREAAEALARHGVTTAQQITASNADDVWKVLLSVPGVGYATANYFLMLLGVPGVKPDTMIKRFLADAAGHKFTDAEAERVVRAAAQQLGVQPHKLDHAIWSFERS